MGDDGIQAVIKRAIADDKFAQLLLADRKTALEKIDLPAAEKAVLLAASNVQLRRMIEQSRKRSWISRMTLGTAAAGAALAVGAAVIIYPMTLTAGIRLEDNRSTLAVQYLHQLSRRPVFKIIVCFAL